MPLVICYQLAQLDKIQGCGIGPQMGELASCRAAPLAHRIQKCMHLFDHRGQRCEHGWLSLLEKSLRAHVLLTGYWPQPCLELPAVSRMPSQFMYAFLKDSDDLSPNWPSKSFYIVRNSDENSLLLELDSASAVLSSLHAFSHSHLRVIPCNMDYFYPPFVGEKTVADFSRAPNPLTGRATTPS